MIALLKDVLSKEYLIKKDYCVYLLVCEELAQTFSQFIIKSDIYRT